MIYTCSTNEKTFQNVHIRNFTDQNNGIKMDVSEDKRIHCIQSSTSIDRRHSILERHKKVQIFLILMDRFKI